MTSRSATACAQRLSASQVATRIVQVHLRVVQKWCSTPFGITGCYALELAGNHHAVLLVLNAFRHHRLLRDEIRLLLPAVVYVLNAFRHHRLLRCAGAAGHFLWHVLNAFRHHRLLRDKRRHSSTFWIWCSTPFGITGCYAYDERNAKPTGRVLNAFRHHRLLRRGHPSDRNRGGVVLNAFRHHRLLRWS